MKQARVEHLTITDMLRERGVEVVFLRELQEEALHGMNRAELPIQQSRVLIPMLRTQDFVLPPKLNHIFTRDKTCWTDGGVTQNRIYWAVRLLKTLNLAAID